jgi:biopolymer transport protein ExbD
MPDNSKKILFISIFVLSFSLLDCKSSLKDYPVDFVDRNAVFAFGKKPNPLMLIVGVDENGKLSLNKIETGTIDDTALLSEKLKAIFEDREKTSIEEREVVVDPQGKVKNEDVEKLIENLADVKASPIRVVRNSL